MFIMKNDIVESGVKHHTLPLW